MKKTKKALSVLTSALIVASSASSMFANTIASSAVENGTNIVEYLDRGINAINTGSGMLVSWRFNADDDDNTVFNLYRGDSLIYTSNAGKATCYLDKGGNASSSYRVDTVVGGKVVSSDKCNFISNSNYFDINLDVPNGGSGYSYTPNDCSTGDVDGDGVYEIFVKWDPTNSQDNSKSGVTGNVYIDCYTLAGKKLWRIDLGKNIRAGAHYTQFLVADFDCDGRAEMTCKTADGTVDGKGKVIGDASKDYRNGSGYVLSGPEYYTLFDGATGEALDTVNYEFPRGNVSGWGDNYGNRVDRFLGAVMYCDGERPSAVSVRGYYTRMTAVAYDVVDKKLVKRWTFDSGNNGSAAGYGDGNHNCMPADVDGDGRQELVLGACCIDDNGKMLWCNNLGHGDAMHLSDFLPKRPGLELWVCHEVQPWGVSLLDAKTGNKIFHYDHSKDTGRCAAGNVLASNPGAEFWGAQSGNVYDGSGKTVSSKRPAQNFLIYWDGDLEREILDWINITKMTSASNISTIYTANGCESNNSTKSTPNLTADLFGDWREELILRTSDNKKLRIHCTPHTTDVRLTTLMHDVTYRTQVAGEQVAYNQPPHTGFYLGSDEALPERPDVIINGEGTGRTDFTNPDSNLIYNADSVSGTGETVKLGDTDLLSGISYVITNKNSGMVLDIPDGVLDAGTNIHQWEKNGASVQEWRIISEKNGYCR
ncbi:MAG: RICIN domain-containing protein, partial [Ruminococcus sp.]|nr:RICIN domain-containing protein [Ruminococcus sp.]